MEIGLLFPAEERKEPTTNIVRFQSTWVGRKKIPQKLFKAWRHLTQLRTFFPGDRERGPITYSTAIYDDSDDGGQVAKLLRLPTPPPPHQPKKMSAPPASQRPRTSAARKCKAEDARAETAHEPFVRRLGNPISINDDGRMRTREKRLNSLLASVPRKRLEIKMNK